MGYDYFDSIHHIGFGMVLQDGKKMSTRGGRTASLNVLLDNSIEGETGPYIQYTCARANSLIKKLKNNSVDYENLEINEYEWNVIFRLNEFEETILKSKDNYDPSLIAKYIIDLAQDFNKLYAN